MNFYYLKKLKKIKNMKAKTTLTNFWNEYVSCANKLFLRLFTFESLIKQHYHDYLVRLLHRYLEKNPIQSNKYIL